MTQSDIIAIFKSLCSKTGNMLEKIWIKKRQSLGNPVTLNEILKEKVPWRKASVKELHEQHECMHCY